MKKILENWRSYQKSLINEIKSGFGVAGKGGIREKAILDILSIFEQPSSPENTPTRALTTFRPTLDKIKSALYRGPDYQTTGTDYRKYKKDNPIPDQKNPNNLGFVEYILDFMVYKLKYLDLLPDGDGEKYRMNQKGAIAYAELAKEQEAVMPGTKQGGDAQGFVYEPSDKQMGKPSGKPFDPKKFMENWRTYKDKISEMKDRYDAPGEMSGDFTPEQEERYDEIYTSVLGVVDDSVDQPNEMHKVGEDMNLMYDSEGEQFMVYYTNAPAQESDYDELFYLDQRDELRNFLADKLFDREQG